MVFADNSSVSTPLAVTSTFACPSVPAGTIFQRYSCCSHVLGERLVQSSGAYSAFQHCDAFAVSSGFNGAHQACRTNSENEDIKNLGRRAIDLGKELFHYALLQSCLRTMNLGYAE